MIFTMLGTNEARFDRLLQGLSGLPDDEELVVQHGPSTVRPPGAICHEFLPFDDVVAHVRRARVVVTHAGVGSIMTCLANGRRPIVVPRRREHAEAVDDHQVPLCARLGAAGLVTVVEDPVDLAAAIAAAEPPRSVAQRPAARLADDLGVLLTSLVADSRRRRGSSR